MTAHPQREQKIRAWLDRLQPGTEFTAQQISKDLNLMGVEVGNLLKSLDNVRKARQEWRVGTIWVKVPA